MMTMTMTMTMTMMVMTIMMVVVVVVVVMTMMMMMLMTIFDASARRGRGFVWSCPSLTSLRPGMPRVADCSYSHDPRDVHQHNILEATVPPVGENRETYEMALIDGWEKHWLGQS